MSEEPQPKRGYAAWKEQHDAVARRNEEVSNRAQTEQKSHANVVETRNREHARRERDQLRALNARLDKQRSRGPR